MHFAKRSIAYLLFLWSWRQFSTRGGALQPHLRASFMDACPIKLSPFHSFYRKNTEGCDRLWRTLYYKLRDGHCFSIHSNVVIVHVQRTNRSSRAYVWINRNSVICWSCSCYSIEGKILNKIPGLCVAKGVRQVWWWYRSHVTCYTCHIYQGVFYRSDDLLIGTCVPMLCVLVTCTSNSQIGNSKRSIPNSGSTIMVAGTAVVFYLLEIIFYPHSSLFTPISLRFWWTFSVSYLLIDEVFI